MKLILHSLHCHILNTIKYMHIEITIYFIKCHKYPSIVFLKMVGSKQSDCNERHGKCSKISNIKKERTPSIYFLSSPFKQREVTNFAKGGNLIASLCKIGYFPHRMFGIFLFEIKILLFDFFRTFTVYIAAFSSRSWYASNLFVE